MIALLSERAEGTRLSRNSADNEKGAKRSVNFAEGSLTMIMSFLMYRPLAEISRMFVYDYVQQRRGV